MKWRHAGPEGEEFINQVKQQPGWYWVCRPLNQGRRAFDASTPVVLPVFAGADGRFSSPLADLDALEPEQLACLDEGSGRVLGTWFAGPIQPGGSEGQVTVSPDGQADGYLPEQEGWRWCRTEGPLKHVDEQGIGPVFLQRDAKGVTRVWPAATPQGRALDVWELGFSEPLVSPGGVIDAHGEHGRRQAEFFGGIAAPEGSPAF